MTERFIPLSKFTGEPVDILERLSQEPIMMDQEAFDINKLPLTEEYNKIKKKKNEKQKKKPNKHLMTKKTSAC